MVLSENGVCCIFYWKESSDLLSGPLHVPVWGAPAPQCLSESLPISCPYGAAPQAPPHPQPQATALETLWIPPTCCRPGWGWPCPKWGSCPEFRSYKEKSSQREPASVQHRQPGKGEEGIPPRDIARNSLSKGRMTSLVISSYSLVALAPFLESTW